jgi:tetratricopeptide (TPR) repeat protein
METIMRNRVLELRDLLQRKNHRKALDLALQLHPKMPDSPFLLRLIADLYGALAHTPTVGQEGWSFEQEAIQWGKRAVQTAPHLAWMWARLGWDYAIHLDHERAHAAFREALKRDECCVAALSGLSSLWSLPENRGEKWISHEEAIIFLKQVVELEFENPGPAIQWLVRELSAAGRHEEARSYAVRGLLSFKPLDKGVTSQFANMLSNDGSLETPA